MVDPDAGADADGATAAASAADGDGDGDGDGDDAVCVPVEGLAGRWPERPSSLDEWQLLAARR